MLARYWLAVAAELDADREGARNQFIALARSGVGPDWVRRWSWLRIADIDVARSDPKQARAALGHALDGAPSLDVDFRRFADYVRRELEWLERHPQPRP